MPDAITYVFLSGDPYKNIIRCVMETIERQFDVTFVESPAQATLQFSTDNTGNYQLQTDLYDLLIKRCYPGRFMKSGNIYRKDDTEDLLATIIFRIQSYQEYNPQVIKDNLGRSTYENTLSDIQNSPFEDAVSPLIKWFLSTNGGIKEPASLNHKRVLLSHDIDLLNSGFKQEYNYFFKRPTLDLGLRLLQHLTSVKKVWSNIEEIIELERSFGAKSVFYLLPDQKKFQHIQNADYSLKTLRRYARKISELGFEVGLHHSPNGNYHQEANIAQWTPPLSNRNHYLRYTSIHQDWQQLSEAGFKIDTGFGWHDTPGFRNGYPMPFHAWLDNDQKLLIVPLVMMDTIYDRNGQIERMEDDLWQMIDQAEDGFTFSILFHNNLLSPWSNHAMLDAYKLILQGLKDRNVQFTTLAELDTYYHVQ